MKLRASAAKRTEQNQKEMYGTPKMFKLFLVGRRKLSSEDVQMAFVDCATAGGAGMRPLALDLRPLPLGSIVREHVAVHAHSVSCPVPQLAPKQNNLVLSLHGTPALRRDK